jgi:aminopeptidase
MRAQTAIDLGWSRLKAARQNREESVMSATTATTAATRSDAVIDPVRLDRLAETMVRVGLNLQEGQDLLLTAPVEALPLVRRIVVHAYKAGAGLVTPLFSDDEITLARFDHARDGAFDAAPDWIYRGMGEAFAANTARMGIGGGDPMLLSGCDAEKVARANRANSKAYRPALEKITGFEINWSLTAYPTEAWARLVFRDLPQAEAQRALAEAIFAATRVNDADPVANWAAHNAALLERRKCQERRCLQSEPAHRRGLHHPACRPGRGSCFCEQTLVA